VLKNNVKIKKKSRLLLHFVHVGHKFVEGHFLVPCFIQLFQPYIFLLGREGRGRRARGREKKRKEKGTFVSSNISRKQTIL
jgi:hypothetical protein